MASAVCLSLPLEFNEIFHNPYFADICCRLEINFFLFCYSGKVMIVSTVPLDEMINIDITKRLALYEYK